MFRDGIVMAYQLSGKLKRSLKKRVKKKVKLDWISSGKDVDRLLHIGLENKKYSFKDLAFKVIGKKFI